MAHTFGVAFEDVTRQIMPGQQVYDVDGSNCDFCRLCDGPIRIGCRRGAFGMLAPVALSALPSRVACAGKVKTRNGSLT